MIRPCAFFQFLILIFLPQVIKSEINQLSLILDADSEEIHYVRGWLEAPAYVDLSQARFLTTVVPNFDDDVVKDDDAQANEDDRFFDSPSPSHAPGDITSAPTRKVSSRVPTSSTSGGSEVNTKAPQPAPLGGRDTKAPTKATDVATPVPTANRRRTGKEEGTETSGVAQKVRQILDVALFLVPDDCKRNMWGGCDWATLGVGVHDDEVTGGLNYCCSENAVATNQCTSDMMGRLIIDPNLFKGEHATVDVPTDPDQEFQLPNPTFAIDITGDYILLFANCDDYGMDVFVVGSMEWKSVNGYLPGELFGLMIFFAVLTVVYLVLVLWYWGGMKLYQDAAIPIQKFILTTIILGFFEFFFRAIDMGTWNLDGLRSMGIIWTAVTVGVFKRGITRCLIVMVSMGWGVIRDSLGMALVKIVVLGLTYCGLTMARDFLLVLSVDKMESWSASTEEELLDWALLVSLAVVVVNVIFFFWIITSLVATTDYLKNMGQTTKLRRHLRLRCIIMTAFVIALSWFVFTIIDALLGILNSAQAWMLEAFMHLNHLFVIVSVAILWRPNPNARDYAMQMELPAMGDDGENELELSCVVPSAGDLDDGNDPDHRNGLPVDDAVVS